jgi:phosphomannomutase
MTALNNNQLGLLLTIMNPLIFKAYDIRGKYPEEIDEDAAYRIGRVIADELRPQKMIVGYDARTMSLSLADSAIKGLTDSGVDVLNIGLVTTDMLYFASGKLNLPGITITGSHNPAVYDGIKIVRAGAAPVSSETGLFAIRDRVLQKINEPLPPGEKKGATENRDILNEYIDHILSFVNPAAIKLTKIVAHTHFGVASLVVKELAKRLPLEIIPLDFEIDGSFPKGAPNPLLPERREETTALVKKSGVDFGVAWDSDADRCFFWDGEGNFIEGYYIGVLLAEILVKKSGKKFEKVVRCPRLGWLFEKIVKNAGGIPLESRVGHSFIKEKMRAENAIFAEEMSGHYYFRENYYADNGMVPFLLILELIHKTGKTLGELIRPYREQMAVSGEFNFEISDPKSAIEKIESFYGKQGKKSKLDGLTMEFNDWRFNIRPSNTEPLARLNIEATSQNLADGKIEELKKIIFS